MPSSDPGASSRLNEEFWILEPELIEYKIGALQQFIKFIGLEILSKLACCPWVLLT
jgi:hypothetical protein